MHIQGLEGWQYLQTGRSCAIFSVRGAPVHTASMDFDNRSDESRQGCQEKRRPGYFN